MKHSQETFLEVVKEAYTGTLKLPAFQRDWKWERAKVISLYDSLRKQFPIGNFLFLEASPDFDLSPRPFAGSSDKTRSEDVERLTLDGQQRITAGIALVYGNVGSPRYFLDLKALGELAKAKNIDYRDDTAVKKFVTEIDDGDNYMIATTQKGELNTLLYEKHWLDSKYLINKISTQKVLEEYENRYSEKKDFLKYMVIPYFTLDNDFKCPIITLTKDESITAVTRIFATLNTTGKRLTPVEIVTATLFAHDINLKNEVAEFHEASDCLKNMDASGELLLQTIALLAGETSKKSLLPITITRDRFKDFYQDALDSLDRVGEFLTRSMGVGLKWTNKLIAYDSILAPMAVVFHKIKNFTGAKKRKAEDKIEKWYVGAALSQRYQEGVHNKQESDSRDMIRWIESNNDDDMPLWLKEVQITKKMRLASPNGAIGRLVKSLINKEEPKDPLENIKVGYYEDADEYPQDHHIWPKKFCSDHVSGWNKEKDSTENIMNIMPLAPKTNKKWDKSDPKVQMDDIEREIGNKILRKECLEKLMLSDECVKILKKTTKTKEDYDKFLQTRFDFFVNKLSRWEFPVSTIDQDFDDATENE